MQLKQDSMGSWVLYVDGDPVEWFETPEQFAEAAMSAYCDAKKVDA